MAQGISSSQNPSLSPKIPLGRCLLQALLRTSPDKWLRDTIEGSQAWLLCASPQPEPYLLPWLQIRLICMHLNDICIVIITPQGAMVYIPLPWLILSQMGSHLCVTHLLGMSKVSHERRLSAQKCSGRLVVDTADCYCPLYCTEEHLRGLLSWIHSLLIFSCIPQELLAAR